MASFLTIPIEVRALIISEVLFSPTPPPPPSSLSRDNRTKVQDIQYISWSCRAYLEQRTTHSPSNCLPLLFTSHQIAAETRAILSLPHTSKYHLDIALVNDFYLLPTWTCVPQLTTEVDELIVSIRTLGHLISTDDVRHQCGDGGHLGFYWSFYALLERFLRYGPVDAKRSHAKGVGKRTAYEDRHVKLKTLTLDVTSAEELLPFPPADIDYRLWHRLHRSVLRKDDRELYTARPEWAAEYLCNQIGALLRVGYGERYVRFMYEGIGAIRVFVEGEMYREWDLRALREELKEKEPWLGTLDGVGV
ncbi:hypothetical protein BJY04DRAFT_197007 [Aspergillus karnatakaensis]|uniref:uncharacterized protein n=1 Tax=Aspergillus karnatakaensis TaxID=1810916 RepID=UPI003CCE437E